MPCNACSPGTKTGTRVRSHVPPERKTGTRVHSLSDPRNRNHKSLAIANHDFEVASFSCRNRNEIAVLKVFSELQ